MIAGQKKSECTLESATSIASPTPIGAPNQLNGEVHKREER